MPSRQVEEWEEWEDDDIVTPIELGEQVSIQQFSHSKPGSLASQQLTSARASAAKASRQSGVKIKRLKSRQRQKAQNAKAGIRLITDMSTFRRQNQPAHQRKPSYTNQGKFVDAAALRALEGEPNSASVGNWNWLKRNKSQSPASATSPPSAQALNSGASDAPIMIGIEVDPEHARRLQAEPQTATNPYLILPKDMESNTGNAKAPSTPKQQQQQSFWSPDTPETAFSFGNNLSPPRVRHASSVYSQVTNIPRNQGDNKDAPPVPTMPDSFKKSQKARIISMEFGKADSEVETPYTAFEEDELSPLQSAKGKAAAKTPDSAGSRVNGWWDHVVSPFIDKNMSFSSRKPAKESPVASAYEQSWNPYSSGKDNKHLEVPKPSLKALNVPIVREPTPRRPSPPLSEAGGSVAGSSVVSAPYETRITEKPRIAVTEVASTVDNPPPYSPPHRTNDPIRYRAVFPPGHPLQSQFPPSPRPASPGLAGTMTSQRSVPDPTAPPRAYTPSLRGQMHTRAPGTWIPREHAYAAEGREHRVERQRRRHEKEEVLARRLGGFWKGRGCIPKNGCFGRSGREGRKRRRVWAGLCFGITVLLILIIALAVVLSRPHAAAAQPSIWVNLTDFPPMPTGVLTVVGPQNNATVSSCTEPSTLWSCSLPKDLQAANAPFKPNQPTVVFQIQWDNSTARSWKTADGQAPPKAPLSSRGISFSSLASSIIRARDAAKGFVSSPPPPSFNEMYFLGDTTDGIQSDKKAGEPTPFYISVLRSVNATIPQPALTKRQDPTTGAGLARIAPAPTLEEDGTPAPAAMIPQPVQQPVRLFDRGLPTEHYGFYTYFSRTIYLKSVEVLNRTDDANVPLDEDGGCRKSEANFMTTWSETRFLVRIWTKKLDSTGSILIGTRGQKASSDSQKTDLIRPGTMPYPVSMTLDTHGGDRSKKLVWEWPMDSRQKLDMINGKALVNNMARTGSLINPRSTGDAKYGGFDGGTGGCKCEWVNWISGTN